MIIKLTNLNLSAGILKNDDYKLLRQFRALYFMLAASKNNDTLQVLKANYEPFKKLDSLFIEINKLEMLDKEVLLSIDLRKDINKCLVMSNYIFNT